MNEQYSELKNEELLPGGAGQRSLSVGVESRVEPGEEAKSSGFCHACCRFIESCQGNKLHGAIEKANIQSKVGEDACAKIMDLISYLPSIFLYRCYMFNTCIAILTAIVFLIAISWTSVYDAYHLSYIDMQNNEQKSVIFIDCDPIATVS